MIKNDAAASTLFSRDAEGYDSLRRRLIRCFDKFYGSALELTKNGRPVPS